MIFKSQEHRCSCAKYTFLENSIYSFEQACLYFLILVGLLTSILSIYYSTI
jgi:hypothetical protein